MKNFAPWAVVWALWMCVSTALGVDPSILTFQEFYDNDPEGQIYHDYAYYLDDQQSEVKHGAEHYWHRSGQLWYEYHWTDGVLDGLERAWWENGQPQYELTWSNGLQQGDVTGYHDNGNVAFEQHWLDGEPTGAWKGWFPAGAQQWEAPYENGVLHGIDRQWYEDGSVNRTTPYENGQKHGFEQWFYSDGTPWRETRWHEGKRHGVETRFHENGVMKDRWNQWVNGILIGDQESWNTSGTRTFLKRFDANAALVQHRQWNDNGFLFLAESYDNGVKHGLWLRGQSVTGRTEWIENWSNGLKHGMETRWQGPDYEQKSLEGNWGNGEKDGDWKEWHVFGEIVLEEVWSAGTIVSRRKWDYRAPFADDQLFPLLLTETQFDQGVESYQLRTKWQSFHDTGAAIILESKTEYVGDLANGREWLYYASGELFAERRRLDNRLHGPYVWYYKDGSVQATGGHSEGLLHGVTLSYRPDGSLESSNPYVFGLLEGKALRYYQDGSLLSSVSYHGGKEHGLSRGWNTDGVLSSETSWRQGLKHGKSIDYYDKVTDSLFPDPDRWVGSLKSSVEYRNGILHGPGKYWRVAPKDGSDDRKDWPPEGVYYLEWERSRSNGGLCGQERRYDWQGNLAETVNHGPCEPFREESPDPPPPGMTTVHGRVVAADTGRPLAEVTVTAPQQTDVTDDEGRYSLFVPSGSVFALRFSKPSHLTQELPLATTARQQVLRVNARLKVARDARPAVTGVTSSSGIVFLQGPSVVNTYTAAVDWGDNAPGWVRFDLNGGAVEVVADAAGAARSYDMGQELIGSLDPKANVLKVTAIAADSIESDTVTLYPAVLPLPGWATALGFTGLGTGGQSATYSFGGVFPDEPVELRFDPAEWNAVVQAAWSLFPFIGGEAVGFPPTQFSAAAGLKTSGEGSIAGGIASGFELGGTELGGKFSLKGVANYVPRDGFNPKEAELVVGVGGEIFKTEGLLTVVPAFKSAQNAPLVGRVIKTLNSLATVEGTVGVEGEMAFKFGYDPNSPTYLEFQNAEPALGGSIGIGLSIDGGSLAELALEGSGALKFIWQLPPNPGYLKEIEGELAGKAELKIIGLGKLAYEMKHTFKADNTGGLALLPAEPLEPSANPVMEIITREFLDQDRYSAFVANEGRIVRPQGTVGPPTGETRLVENVFPESSVAIATHNGRTAIAHVHFDPADATLQATEIHFIWHDGTSYSAPAAILDDTRAEYAPSLAFDANGKVVAVWERIKDPAFASGELVDLLSNLEIVTAVFDPASGQWSAPVALTDNAHLDHTPTLARGRDGSVLLGWQSNAGNELIGTADRPTQVHWAFWDPDSEQFDPAQAIGAGFIDALNFSLAHDGAESVLVYTRDMDGDLATGGDHEVFRVLRDAQGWGATVRLTDDAVADANPEAIYKADGSQELVWKHGDDLVRLTDWQTGAFATIRADSGSASFLDFRLTCDPQGRLAVIWQALSPEGVDLFYSVHDPTMDVWSMDLQLTADAPLEKAFRGGLDANGTLQLAFLKEDRTTGAVDLFHLVRPLGRDVKVAAADLSLDPAQPALGTGVTIRAIVRNTGDLAVENVAVGFYLGDPDAGGQLFGSANATPSVLRGGESGEATLAWTVPQPLDEPDIFVLIDAAGAVAETDEANNRASFAIHQPDLVAAGCRVEEHGDGSLDAIVTVENLGLTAATDVAVLFAAEGAEIGAITLPNLAAGASAEVATLIWADLQLTNRPSDIRVTLDPEDLIAESNEDNNTCSRVFTLTVDVDKDGMEDSWERVHFGDHDRNGQLDFDGDGMIDALEFLAGTDPRDARSLFLGAITRPGVDGTVAVAWAAETGRTYQVQYKDDLNDPGWTDLGSPATLDGSSGMIVDTPPAEARQRIYRIVLINP